jgi:hypothetical protein
VSAASFRCGGCCYCTRPTTETSETCSRERATGWEVPDASRPPTRVAARRRVAGLLCTWTERRRSRGGPGRRHPGAKELATVLNVRHRRSAASTRSYQRGGGGLDRDRGSGRVWEPLLRPYLSPHGSAGGRRATSILGRPVLFPTREELSKHHRTQQPFLNRNSRISIVSVYRRVLLQRYVPDPFDAVVSVASSANSPSSARASHPASLRFASLPVAATPSSRPVLPSHLVCQHARRVLE